MRHCSKPLGPHAASRPPPPQVALLAPGRVPVGPSAGSRPGKCRPPSLGLARFLSELLTAVLRSPVSPRPCHLSPLLGWGPGRRRWPVSSRLVSGAPAGAPQCLLSEDQNERAHTQFERPLVRRQNTAPTQTRGPTACPQVGTRVCDKSGGEHPACQKPAPEPPSLSASGTAQTRARPETSRLQQGSEIPTPHAGI